MKLWQKNLILAVIVVVISVIPLVFMSGAEFSGADGLAKEAIVRIAPNYEPWYKSWFPPASSEIESLLFALQAALGAGFVGFVLGRITSSKKDSENN